MFGATVLFETADSPATFIACFGIFGIGTGLFMPPVPLILNKHVAKERLGTANGIVDGMGALSRVVGPLTAARLYEVRFHWIVAGTPLLFALPLLLILPGDPPLQRLHPPLLPVGSAPEAAGELSSCGKRPKRRRSVFEEMTLPHDDSPCDTEAMKVTYSRKGSVSHPQP